MVSTITKGKGKVINKTDTLQDPLIPEYVLAVTWCPTSRETQPLKQLEELKPLLTELNDNSMSTLWYPELTKNGNIHLHGVLSFNSNQRVKFYKALLPRMRQKGFVLIKYNPDSGWYNYIEKESDFMKEVLGQPVPLTTDFFAQRKEISHCVCKPKDITQQCVYDSDDSNDYNE